MLKDDQRRTEIAAERAITLAQSEANGASQDNVLGVQNLIDGNRALSVRAQELCMSSGVDTEIKARALAVLQSSLQGSDSFITVPMSIRERTAIAVAEPKTSAYAPIQVEHLRDVVKETMQRIGRSVFLALVAAALFELALHSVIGTDQLGPFRLRNASTIEKILPALFAFLCYDVINLNVRRWWTTRAYSELVRNLAPGLDLLELRWLGVPPRTSLFGTYLPPYPLPLRSLLRFLENALPILLGLGAFLFEGLAFYQLVRAYGFVDWLVLASASFSAAFILYGSLLQVVQLHAHGLRWDQGTLRMKSQRGQWGGPSTMTGPSSGGNTSRRSTTSQRPWEAR
jgi:hypothetical protein